MTKITVSAKIPPDMIEQISRTGFLTSDIMQVALEMFLALTPDKQGQMIADHIYRKKRNRAIERLSGRTGKDREV